MVYRATIHYGVDGKEAKKTRACRTEEECYAFFHKECANLNVWYLKIQGIPRNKRGFHYDGRFYRA